MEIASVWRANLYIIMVVTTVHIISQGGNGVLGMEKGGCLTCCTYA